MSRRRGFSGWTPASEKPTPVFIGIDWGSGPSRTFETIYDPVTKKFQTSDVTGRKEKEPEKA